MPRLYRVLQAKTDVCVKIRAYSLCVRETETDRENEKWLCIDVKV